MLHTDIPSRAEIDDLMRVRSPSCASLYVRTDPKSLGDAERLRLKNLAREAITQLRQAGASTDDIDAIEDQIADLEHDDIFWRYQARSLAVFVTPSSRSTFRLPDRLQQQVAVSDRFHVTPLLRAVTLPQTAFILALAQNSVRLLEILPDLPPQPVSVPDMPSDAASAAVKSLDEPTSWQLQGREPHKIRMRGFARQVDQALRQVLPGQGVPLVLAATEPLDSVFRSLCHYPDLAPATIAGNPEDVGDDGLATRAREVIDQWHADQLKDLHGLFEHRASQDQTAVDVADIARFATMGAIDVLFVDIDAQIPGLVDEQTGAVSFESDSVATYNVVDEITRRTWFTGGRVLALRRDDIPGGGELAAVLRYVP